MNASNYDWTKPQETLENIKRSILDAMRVEEKWYVNARCWNSIYSRSIRIISIIFFAFGILWPIVKNKFEDPDLDIGYISLAIGGLLLLLDKYLGISSGYVRFYIAELDIKKNTREFIENWDIETAKTNSSFTQENTLSFLNLVKTFRQSVYTTIQVETGAWATEFQTQTGELYELFKQKQSEYSKPANISVELQNYLGYTNIEIGIDSETPIKLNGETSIIFRNVSLEPHLIILRATKDNEVISFSKNADTNDDKTTLVLLQLP